MNFFDCQNTITGYFIGGVGPDTEKLDGKYFEAMNEVYKTKFTEPYPARTCVAVLELPLSADVELEVVAKRWKTLPDTFIVT